MAHSLSLRLVDPTHLCTNAVTVGILPTIANRWQGYISGCVYNAISWPITHSGAADLAGWTTLACLYLSLDFNWHSGRSLSLSLSLSPSGCTVLLTWRIGIMRRNRENLSAATQETVSLELGSRRSL